MLKGLISIPCRQNVRSSPISSDGSPVTLWVISAFKRANNLSYMSLIFANHCRLCDSLVSLSIKFGYSFYSCLCDYWESPITDIEVSLQEEISEFMKRSSNSSQSATSVPPIDNNMYVFCRCGLKSPLQTARTRDNRGRRYHNCPRYKPNNRGESCDFCIWDDAEINQSAWSVSKNFHQSNVEEEPVSTHDKDDGNSMDIEIKALKAQLRRWKNMRQS